MQKAKKRKKFQLPKLRGKRGISREWLESIDPEKRLALLQAYMKFKSGFASKEQIAYRRSEFNKIANELCTLGVCYVCSGLSSHRHHVIPLFFNGSNSSDNLVPLCSDCHNAVHSANSDEMDIFYNHPVFGWEPGQFSALREGRKRYSGPKQGCLSSFSGISIG